MASRENTEPISFLRWALPGMGYRWDAFRKPRRQILHKIRKRMEQLDLYDFSEYREYLNHHPEEWVVLERLCDVTISKFYRNRRTWEYLRDRVLPKLVRQRAPAPVRFWSVGCCNGEEPYSLAMILWEVFEKMRTGEIPAPPAVPSRETGPAADEKGAVWPCPVSILATDRNREVLERAKRGFYPAPALRELTAREIRDNFRP